MESNPQLELAYDFLEYTGVNVFLTGKAGTGKTTFLRELKRRSPKRMIVVAPTGVAAINAGGVTIHSFFQLPFGPYVPGVTEVVGQGDKLHYTHKFNREKINIIKTIDLLVIDEIELLECNLPEIKVRVVCSKGTYIRALARDIGEALHSGAHLTALERTRVGDVRIEDCLNPLDFKEWIDGQDLVISDEL